VKSETTTDIPEVTEIVLVHSSCARMEHTTVLPRSIG
jgi:hypothetical protein